MAAYPVLESQDEILESVIKLLRFLVRVDAPESPDLCKDPPPAELEPDRHVLTEMLDRPDPVVEPVLLLLRLEMGIVEIRIPSGVPARNKVGHVRPRQRADRVDVRGMHLHQGADVLPARTRSEYPAAGMIAPGREVGEHRIRHRESGAADDADDLSRLRWGENHREVVHVHRAEHAPLLFGMAHFRGAEHCDPLGKREFLCLSVRHHGLAVIFHGRFLLRYAGIDPFAPGRRKKPEHFFVRQRVNRGRPVLPPEAPVLVRRQPVEPQQFVTDLPGRGAVSC